MFRRRAQIFLVLVRLGVYSLTVLLRIYKLRTETDTKS